MAENKEETVEYDGPYVDKNIVYMSPDDKRHEVELYGSWNRFSKGEELTYEGKQKYTVVAKIPLGNYVYRFLIDGEEWETTNSSAKTVQEGIEYNSISVRLNDDDDEDEDDEDEDSSNKAGGDAAQQPQGENTQLIFDETQQKFVIGKKKKGKRRGRPSMELDLGANFADDDAEDAADADAEDAASPQAASGDAAPQKKKKTKKYKNKRASVDIEKEKEWARYVFTQQLRMKEQHNEEITRVKTLWKQERQVRTQMHKKVKEEKKAVEKDLSELQVKYQELQKVNEARATGDKKLQTELENQNKQLTSDLEAARAELVQAKQASAQASQAQDQQQQASAAQDAKIAELQQEVAKSRAEAQEKNKALVAAETRLAELESSLEAQKKQLQIEKDAFSSQLQGEREKTQQMKSTALKLNSQFAAVRGELKAIKDAKISQLEEMVNAFDEFRPLLSKVLSFNQGMVDDLMQKYKRELTLRRKYFNIVQNLRGNIRVFCRVRPILPFEQKKGDTSCLTFPDPGKIVVQDEKDQKHNFEFDQVYRPGTTQEAVSEDTTEYIQSVMDGYNVSIFAYGQTGSGKTFTMDGSPEEPGVNLRALKCLFKMAEERAPQFEYKIKVSIFEIYNEQIKDLLMSSKKKKKSDKRDFKILHLPDGSVDVQGLTWKAVKTDADVVQLSELAKSQRTAGVTDMNAHSSRSHMVVVVDVKGFNLPANIEYLGKLYLVDLAGSERVKKSGATGQAMKEAQNINKSLAALGDVMQALQKKEKFIPYRNSVLTDLMTNSLGGNAKTVMFINCCPTARHAFETVSSLKFASRVGKVELGQAKAKQKKSKK